MYILTPGEYPRTDRAMVFEKPQLVRSDDIFPCRSDLQPSKQSYTMSTYQIKACILSHGTNTAKSLSPLEQYRVLVALYGKLKVVLR